MLSSLNEIPLFAWIIIVFLLISQSTWMFMNARKHGHNCWLWGTLGLIQFPTYLIIYLIFARKKWKKRK